MNELIKLGIVAVAGALGGYSLCLARFRVKAKAEALEGKVKNQASAAVNLAAQTVQKKLQ